jgi:methylphosphotriester-DNA--protein-cysteine methyltransferase
MNDTNERSCAARGSHVELHRAVRALLDGVNARYAKNPREWACPHMQALDDMTQSEPQPTLADEERRAISLARSVFEAHYRMSPVHNAADEALEQMLERLG